MDAGGQISAENHGQLSLEAIRIATDAARAAERSAGSAMSTLERAEQSLKQSEERMAEVSAAAVAAAGEATEARLRATEIATEFRALEEKVSGALQATRVVRKRPEPTLVQEAPEATPTTATATERGPAGATVSVPTPEPVSARPLAPPPAPSGGTTAEFEALWQSFDSKADRIVERLKALEQRTMTVIRTPQPPVGRPGTHSPRSAT